jgi:SPP1 gp7 family putative phage head morphogenesis protein
MSREEWEYDLAKAVGRLQARQLSELLDTLGNPPDLNRLTPEYWKTFSAQTRSALLPELQKIYLSSAQMMLDEFPSIGVSWDLANQAAADWSSQYGFDLVRGIGDNTRTALQKKLSAFFEQSMTMPQLRDSLTSLFGPVRAEMIASTETTRAAVNGQQAIVTQLNKQGIPMVPTFTTSRDEHVCPICSPLNGKRVSENQFPPRHPRCRCSVAMSFQK